MAADIESEREWFERMVAVTAPRPCTPAAVRVDLKRQLAFQVEPSEDGLEELSVALAGWLKGERELDGIGRVVAAHPAQPLAHFYAFAMRREAGALDSARESLRALQALDASDPMAAQLASELSNERVPAASEQTRVANIAKLASTPLLRNPYQLATGPLFEAIREQEVARVLDVGVGSGAQLAELIGLLCEQPHRVRRLELVGLDFNEEFLQGAGERIAATRAPAETEIAYVPVLGRIEELGDDQVREIVGPSGLDAANATIALHEVPGERKLAALAGLRRAAPAHLLIAEWNYLLENTLADTSVEFLFNVRNAATGFVSALTERYSHADARAVVRDWLSQGDGQLTCPAARRQECFLPVACWRALLERSGFRIAPGEKRWLAHAEWGDRASLQDGGTWIATASYGGWSAIALLHATPA